MLIQNEKFFKTEVRNSDNSDFVYLNEREYAMSEVTQGRCNEVTNALGFEIPITTLTGIHKLISEQKFYTVAPAKYVPVKVGNNAWSSNIETFREYNVGGDFFAGIINQASDNSKLAQADSGIDGVNVKVSNWAKGITYNIFQLQQAALLGNWDIVTSKERARKKNWDLGIQEVAFLGNPNDPGVLGLLTQPDVNANLSLITKYIKSMNAAEFQALLAGLIPAYLANCVFTAMPNKFVIPYLDYAGLASSVDETFPLKSRLERLEESLKAITMNSNFEVLPCAYCDTSNNSLGANFYVLYNSEESSVRMDIPVDYTSTLQNTLNGFQFQNVGYGQFTGVKAYRNLEMLYFKF